MKIRTGFVSNSSSSSFIVAVRKTTHDEAMKKLSPKYQEIIGKMVEFESAFGIELAVHGCFSDASGHSNYSGSLDYYEYENQYAEDDPEGDGESILYIAIEDYNEACRAIETDSFHGYVSDGG